MDAGSGGERRLLLFDIDGTLLVGATDSHREALRYAMLEVHGVDVERAAVDLAVAGRTDGEIARLILTEAGISEEAIDARTGELAERAAQAYAELCEPDLSDFVTDGIPDLLAWLSAIPGVRLALVTGNFETVARLKLARAGIGARFAAGQGAFASDAEDRRALPPIARRRAGSGGAPFPRRHTLLVGDTPRDIACARAGNARAVAVATGGFSRDALEAHAPDAVLDDLHDTEAVIATLLNGALR
jgi:phosphoglycolate phosphatase